MKNFIISIGLIFVVSGCSTVGSVNKSYSRINQDDGISMREAKIIAKKTLMDSKFNGEFQLIRPEIMNNHDTYPHPNYWFVRSDQKRIGFNDSYYLVVIDKRSGDVLYAKNHKPYPTDIKGYHWIFALRASLAHDKQS